MMAQWFGPRGFTSSVPELDLRVGGALRIVMHGPDGNDYPMKGVFREIVKPERLVFSNIAIDNDGNRLLEGETTVTLSEHAGKTTLTVKSHMVGKVPVAVQMLAGMEAGWTQTIDKLGELVSRVSDSHLSEIRALGPRGDGWLTQPAKRSTPAERRWPIAQRRASGCGVLAPRR